MLTAALLGLSLTVQSPAVAISVRGVVEVDAGSGPTQISRFAKIEEGSRVITKDSASAQLRLASGSILRLGPNTEINLTTLSHGNPAGKRKESMKLVVGRLWARVTKLFGNDTKFEVETKSAVAGVRGTSFVVESRASDDRFVLIDGVLNLDRGGGTSAVLDQPGAFLTSGADSFGPKGTLDTSALNALRRDIAGAGATITEELPVFQPGATGPRGLRRGTRGDITGPGQLVDTPLGISPNDTRAPNVAADVQVEVEIILNDPN